MFDILWNNEGIVRGDKDDSLVLTFQLYTKMYLYNMILKIMLLDIQI